MAVFKKSAKVVVFIFFLRYVFLFMLPQIVFLLFFTQV